ncbi:Uncharacterised protein [Bordetella pertussis]|nr:Uncharacterised protein [Bordetella pertussis]
MACTPMICENGVTMIGQARSSRTRPISSRISSKRFSSPAWRNWKRQFSVMPPGIWCR